MGLLSLLGLMIVLTACEDTPLEPVVVDINMTVETDVISDVDEAFEVPELAFEFMIEAFDATLYNEIDDEDEDFIQPMPSNDIVTITHAGEVVFGEIEFTEVGVFVYRVTQIVPEEIVEDDEVITTTLYAWVFDDTDFEIEITVEEVDGELIATIESDELVFTNTYEPAITEAVEAISTLFDGEEISGNIDRSDYDTVRELIESIQNEAIREDLLAQLEAVDIELTTRETVETQRIAQEAENASATNQSETNVSAQGGHSGNSSGTGNAPQGGGNTGGGSGSNSSQGSGNTGGGNNSRPQVCGWELVASGNITDNLPEGHPGASTTYSFEYVCR